MTCEDIHGCAMTTERADLAAPWNAMIRAFLTHSAETPVHLTTVLAIDPGFALAHVARGVFSLLLGRRELVAVARSAADLARSSMAVRGATPRERHYLGALDLLLDGHRGQSVTCLEMILRDDPHDALAMKLSQAIRFMRGDQAGMRWSVERLLPIWGQDHPASGYLRGCHAFTLGETGDYARAEAQGRAGLELAADDAWGLHAIAHIHDMTGRSREGVRFLEANTAAWSHCNNFRYHVWWHLALLYLDHGKSAQALALYDAEVRRDRTDDYRDIANATSLLARLELEGVNVGGRWEELADLCAARVDDGCLVFADLHYMIALRGGDRDTAAADLLKRMRVDALRSGQENAAVTRDPGVALAQGLLEFRSGAYDAAFANLSDGRASLSSIGGSKAQRDIFERLTIEAAIRAGNLHSARNLIEERTRGRGHPDGFAEGRARRVEELLRAEVPKRVARRVWLA